MVVQPPLEEQSARRQVLPGPEEVSGAGLEPPFDALPPLLDRQEVARLRKEPRQLRLLELQEGARERFAKVPGVAVEQQKAFLGPVQSHAAVLDNVLEGAPAREFQAAEVPVVRLEPHRALEEDLGPLGQEPARPGEFGAVMLMKRDERLAKPLEWAPKGGREVQQPRLHAPLERRQVASQLALLPMGEK